MAKASIAYFWFDAEFSSLELEEAQLLQVSMLATDASLKRLLPAEDDVNLFIKLEDEEALSPWVKEHIPQIIAQAKSDTAVSVESADAALTEYINKICGGYQKSFDKRGVLAGNSIHNDWAIARRLLPELTRHVHYRLLDVSMLKTLFIDTGGDENLVNKDDDNFLKTWFPEANLPEGGKAHDAYYDIQASIAELAFYKDKMMV